MSKWITDPRGWDALPLADRLELLRKHYCTGPCGQSHSVLATRAATSKTLREAVVTFSGLAGKGDRLPWARLEGRPTCQQLFAGVESVIAREVEVIESQLRRNDVSVLSAVASFVDPHDIALWGYGTQRSELFDFSVDDSVPPFEELFDTEMFARTMNEDLASKPAAQRSYQANAQTIKVQDEVLQNAVNL